MRRSAASIPINIAEGCGRRTDNDLAHFFDIAMRSACEVEYQLFLAKDLTYIDHAKHTELEPQITEVKRMLSSFIAKVRLRIKDQKER
jgi:four helix bundle protein